MTFFLLLRTTRFGKLTEITPHFALPLLYKKCGDPVWAAASVPAE